jgi:hypothetical protein
VNPKKSGKCELFHTASAAEHLSLIDQTLSGYPNAATFPSDYSRGPDRWGTRTHDPRYGR